MDTSVIKKSVTAGDYSTSQRRPMIIGTLGHIGTSLEPTPPDYWSQRRDRVLASTLHYESFWASAVYTAISKIVAKDWATKGPESSARRARDVLFSESDRGGWSRFISRHLADYLLADNGAFFEIIRASNAAGSRVIGLAHLPARRCFRTHDPSHPVIYQDRSGREHLLKDYQVVCLSDMPNSDEDLGGLGLCAASRAYEAIYRTHVISRYIGEKTSGRRPLSLHFVSNISNEQVDDAIQTAKDKRQSEGLSYYMGSVIIPGIDPSQGVQLESVELAALPDGFDAEQEYRRAGLIYANSIGLDPQDVDPQLLASRALGTGAQARVIDDKASGKGIVAWEVSFTHAINEYVVPGRVTFGFEENDYRDQIQVVSVQSQQAALVTQLTESGFMLPEQGQQVLIDKGVIPAEFAMTDDLIEYSEVPASKNPVNKLAIRPPTLAPSSERGLQTQAPREPMSPREQKSYKGYPVEKELFSEYSSGS